MMRFAALATVVLLALGACKEEDSPPPPPVSMTEDALGVYCQMSMAEHPGPKAQVLLQGQEAPLFFAQVRDAIAYQRMPEQDGIIAAIYVSDMGAAPSWENPGADNWIAADSAFYVVGAEIAGGMGVSELVPFAGAEAAEAFARDNGGEVVSLDQIGDEQVLAPVEYATDADGNFLPPEGEADAEGTN